MNAPPVIEPAAAKRRPAWLPMLALGALTVSIGAVLFLFNPAQHGFYPRCMLYRMTGIYCPGCGSLRALHQLSHSHLLTAMQCNLPLVLSLPFLAYSGFKWMRCWLVGAPLPDLTIQPRVIAVIVVALLAFTILRNIHCEPFTWLAPP